MNVTVAVAKELRLTEAQVSAVLELFEEGCTVPFIARYRKEATGSLDETVVTAIRDRNEKIQEIEKRRTAILESLVERELLTDELKVTIDGAQTMTALEDAYLPYRPKRKTRASVAIEKGLKPLAEKLLEQLDAFDPEKEAVLFLSEEKGVASVEDALAGAQDILAERFSEDTEVRQQTRKVFARKAMLASARAKAGSSKEDLKEDLKEGAKATSKEDSKSDNYRDYFEWSEPVVSMPSHRVLAIFRGEREGFLSISVEPPEEECLSLLKRMFVRGVNPASRLVAEAVLDGYKRLLKPSMENELRNALKKRADAEAIRVFAGNVKEVLMAAPMGQKATLGIDPGLRTGCKVVCLDAQGNFLHNDVIFPHTGERQRSEAVRKIVELVKKYRIQAIAIGNGTAGRETEAFVRGLGLPPEVIVASVNESGASIYSASEVARREFPDQDVTVRGAVSIGRRLMDPMAELVKIDPKSIGVGQYQHDVDQKELKQSLDDVVMSCVNAVGVEVNTASLEILSYISGLSKQVAGQLIKYRETNGPFASRDTLKKVPRLGPKTFEQAAGFLRIHGGKNPLDASAVHPENYSTVERMAKELKCTVADLMASSELRSKIDLERFVSEKAGLPTLKDIVQELAKPGRDPRVAFEAFAFDPDVREIGDLRVGMVLPGIVTNVTAFGAFVDLGVHQDGLVHVSRLSDSFVENPQAFLKPGQKVKVAVLEVDEQRKRVSLSMRKRDLEADPSETASRTASDFPRPIFSHSIFSHSMESMEKAQGNQRRQGGEQNKKQGEEKNKKNEETIDLSLGSLFKQQLADADLSKGRGKR
ncbi:MAG: RNA-binding transcriptional accessory protein [Synergistaceae bacterium]|nr:RNA-binding transcriptional accessory protein [Synergistaceae bacterium]